MISTGERGRYLDVCKGRYQQVSNREYPPVCKGRYQQTGTSADRVDYGDTFRPGSLEREGDQLSLEATTRRSRRRVEHRWFFL
ncbi:hypothetical protein J6590_072031 [Homalodisca vitripennis]|nr:hypothetical protein J6590_072031 [Homalodisca vitripennis]